MKPPPFEYVTPGTLADAVARKAADGDDALVLAGGQSLIPLLALRLASPTILIDLGAIADLAYVRADAGSVAIGAMTRHRDVEVLGDLDGRLSLLEDALPCIGHRAIRNRGTVGGSVAHADPAAEWPALAMALEATVEAVGPAGARSIDAADFFAGPFTNALRPDEIVREVRLQLPQRGAGSAFVEHSRRYGDFALVGVATVLEMDVARRVSRASIALVGVGGGPIRATRVEAGLVGGPLTEDAIATASTLAEEAVDPPNTVHASAAYRRHLVRVLVGRALRLAGERASVA
jgi:carbon-monoxide dehydrogenase medium subunit